MVNCSSGGSFRVEKVGELVQEWGFMMMFKGFCERIGVC